MSISSSDRIAFSLAIVTSAAKIAGINYAQTLLASTITQLQNLDTAHKNLLDPVNALVTGYQNEYQYFDGNARTSFVESDILAAVNRAQNNDFYPNNTAATVPSLSATNNVWTQVPPYALNFAIGKNYGEAYGTTTTEASVINQILAYITTAQNTYTDIENTTGEQCVSGTCSLPQYPDESSCTTNGGVWTPEDTIQAYPDIQTLKTNIVAVVNSLLTILQAEAAAVPKTDTDATRGPQNTAALNNLNNVIIPAINAWLGYPDFNTVTGAVDCMTFNSYNPALLAPTKLYSGSLTTLQNALNARITFGTTRATQLATALGSVTQNVADGSISASSGLYGTRYSYLSLRINALSGSLSQLTALQNASTGQNAQKASLQSSAATYATIVPTSILKAAGNATNIVHVVDTSFLSNGDLVYLYCEGQTELTRAVKSINGDAVTLNDVVPATYDPSNNGRIYKSS